MGYKSEAHDVLDKALDELRLAYHLQLDVAQITLDNHMTDTEALEQSSELIQHLLRQVQMICLPQPAMEILQSKYRERAFEARMFVGRFKLDALEPLLTKEMLDSAD